MPSGAVPPLIEARGIVKRFGAILANDNVDLDVGGGQLHALLGENGAGKSTLCKILCGFYRADAGEIRIGGDVATMPTPRDARARGIGMVFQNFMLVPALSVYENIALFLTDPPALLRSAEILLRVRDYCDRFGLALDPWVPVRVLSVGEQQKLEILKQLVAGARVLILDEPTSVLAPPEAEALFGILAALKQEGYGILFITHKLREVLACADRITVMRHGRVTGSMPRVRASEEALLSLMFGRTVGEERRERRAARPPTRPVLELAGLSSAAGANQIALRDVTLRVHEGEIVGVAGVAGSGQSELGEAILGIRRPVTGQKLLWGEDATDWSIRRLRDRGIAFIPENALAMATIPGMSLRENFALGWRRRVGAGVAIDWPGIRVAMEAAFANLGFPMPPPERPMGALSGGTLQRAVLARELAEDPSLIVALYPTRGLDVPSAAAVRELLMRARDAGKAVLLISEDLDELFVHCDRLLVMFGGAIAGELLPDRFDAAIIGPMMTGLVDARHAR
jgi:ABC-type uncharacterized transport system ATPase subunit